MVVWLEVVCVEGWGIGLWKVGVSCEVGLLWGCEEAMRMGWWGEHGLWVGVCNEDKEGV